MNNQIKKNIPVPEDYIKAINIIIAKGYDYNGGKFVKMSATAYKTGRIEDDVIMLTFLEKNIPTNLPPNFEELKRVEKGVPITIFCRLCNSRKPEILNNTAKEVLNWAKNLPYLT